MIKTMNMQVSQFVYMCWVFYFLWSNDDDDDDDDAD